MKNRTCSWRTAAAAAVVFLAAPFVAQAAYTMYYSDSLASINSGYWNQTGTVSASAAGITSATAGTLISKVTAPGNANDYQVSATVSLPNNVSGGSYGILFRASSNAQVSPAQGSYYLAELQNVTYAGNGSCSATLVLYKSVNGAVSQLSSVSSWCASAFGFRVFVKGSNILIYQGVSLMLSTTDSSLTSGQPGLSVRNAPATSTIYGVNLGPGDSAAPTPVDLHNLSTSSYPGRIDMQWKGAADDPNGAGVAWYTIYRNGSQVATFPAGNYEFTDNAVTASTTYSYVVTACDYFGNCASTASFNAATAPAGAIDPRQIGLRPNATQWGAGGENVNILSGNLNFTLPLLTAKTRGGMSVGIGLNYNSQSWRQDSAGVWNYGRDTGYGYGVRVLAGSMQMFYSANWGTDHWVFTDSTGAEYRFDQRVNQDGSASSSYTGLWATTLDSSNLIFDQNANKLYFPSGVWWQFGSYSTGNEGDESARYPTLMEDTNGNQILIRYKPGVASVDAGGNSVYLGWPNSSGRIDQIEDSRAFGSYTYQFNYNNDTGVPHLTSITNRIGTSEGYSFSYNTNQTLYSPWWANYGTTTQLSGITISGIGLQYQLYYDGNGSALNKVIYPYGGYVGWAYADAVYSASRTQREVSVRYLSKDGTVGSQTQYMFTPLHDASNTTRQSVILDDPGGVGEKFWSFYLPGATYQTLLATYEGRDRSTTPAAVLQRVSPSFSAAAFGPYLSSTTTTMNPGSPSAVAKRVDQISDQWGNLLSMSVYDYNGTVRRTYSNTYLNSSAYTTRYIRNRVATTNLSEGGVTTLLASNGYDYYNGLQGGLNGTQFNCPGQGMATVSGNLWEFDTAFTAANTVRGNLTQSMTLSGQSCAQKFDNTGNVVTSQDPSGLPVTVTTSATTNFNAPSAITVGTLTETFQYAADLLPTSATGPNGDTTSTVYDSYARPASTTSASGATTYFNYVNSPPQVLSYLNGRASRTTLDGFGRTVKAESGPATYSNNTIALTSVVSQVDTTYDSCGCSPLGKLKATSRPHAPGAAVYWTVNTYDGIGRTVKVVAPDGASAATYGYAGSQVTTTDPAGKWKTFTTDAVGNLTQVAEPDPNSGTVLTNYVYDLLNRLRTVTMPRPTGTQTRTFTYTGALLTSSTNPENGTVKNYYNADNTLKYKVDAKGQATVYSYDSYKRVTQISKYPNGYVPSVAASYELASLGGRAATAPGSVYGVSVSPAAGNGTVNVAQNITFAWAPAGSTFGWGYLVIQDSAVTTVTQANACYIAVSANGAAEFADDTGTLDTSNISWVGNSWARTLSNSHCQLNGPASSFVTVSGQNVQVTLNVQFASAWNGKTLAIWMAGQNSNYQTGTYQQFGTLTLGPSFNLTATGTTVAAGSSGSSTVTVVPANGFNSSVALAAASWPSGITGTFSPASTTSSSSVAITVGSSVAPGSYALAVNGTSGSLTGSTSIALTVTAAGSGGGGGSVTSVTPSAGSGSVGVAKNFQLVWSGPAMGWAYILIQDSAVTTPTTANACYVAVSTNGAAELGDDTGVLDGMNPSWVGNSWAKTLTNSHCVFNGAASSFVTVTGSGTTVLQVTLNVQFTSAQWNNKTLAIWMETQNTNYQSSGWLQYGTFALGAAQGSPGFTLSAAPVSVAVGSNTGAGVTVGPVNGFSSAVTLATSGWPSGITASAFTPNPATGSSAFTIYVGSLVSIGTYQLTVTGSGGGVGPVAVTIPLSVTNGGNTEDVCQRVNYYYDTNPDTTNNPYGFYTSGRMTSVHYAGANCSATGGNNYVEMFAYTQAGKVTNKTFRLSKTGSASADLEAVYTYDTEGKMTSMKYPLGTTYQYAYDNMGRPNQMTDASNSQNLVSAVTYGPAGELVSMTGTAVNETRTYNAMGQLTQLTGINVNLKYTYAATGANNGQIVSQQDVLSGETVTYAYDSLKRLSSATSSQGWGQGFGYDGFGNLTAKTMLSGAPPVGSYPVDAATNRLSGIPYDANGNQLYANSMNLSYDVANRMTVSTGTSMQALYEYNGSNKRVYQLRQSWNGSNWVTNAQEWYFYGIDGKKLGTYNLSGSSWSLQSAQVFFRGKLIRNTSQLLQEDIRGSVGRYYPYGEDRDNTANDAVKFGTYTRDSVTGLDYGVNRYHEPGTGRFASPDPYDNSGMQKDPGSWNHYSYVQGDPVNAVDSKGTKWYPPWWCDIDPEDPACVDPDPDPCGPDPGPVLLSIPLACGPGPARPAVKHVPKSFVFVGAAYNTAYTSAYCDGNHYGAYITEQFQILDEDGNPFFGSLPVQEQVLAFAVVINGVLQGVASSTVWTPAATDQPSSSNGSGVYFDSPYGGCDSYSSTNYVFLQRYEVFFNGVWVVLNGSVNSVWVEQSGNTLSVSSNIVSGTLLPTLVQTFAINASPSQVVVGRN